MAHNEKYSGLDLISEERKNDLVKRDKIVKEKDYNSLFLLNDNSDFTIALHEILDKKYSKSPESLSVVELNLLLAIHIENAGQSGSILNFLQEWFPQYSNFVINSLKEIGATKSSEIIKNAVEILPKDGSWFYDNANEDEQNKMESLNNEFSDYPDGDMNLIYKNYAVKNRSEIY